jgi:hypothetical protein
LSRRSPLRLRFTGPRSTTSVTSRNMAGPAARSPSSNTGLRVAVRWAVSLTSSSRSVCCQHLRGDGASKPRARACATAWVRLRAPSFWYRCRWWVLTVFTDRYNSPASSGADRLVGRFGRQVMQDPGLAVREYPEVARIGAAVPRDALGGVRVRERAARDRPPARTPPPPRSGRSQGRRGGACVRPSPVLPARNHASAFLEDMQRQEHAGIEHRAGREHGSIWLAP